MPAKVAISCNRKEEGKETKGTGGQERDGEEDFRKNGADQDFMHISRTFLLFLILLNVYCNTVYTQRLTQNNQTRLAMYESFIEEDLAHVQYFMSDMIANDVNFASIRYPLSDVNSYLQGQILREKFESFMKSIDGISAFCVLSSETDFFSGAYARENTYVEKENIQAYLQKLVSEEDDMVTDWRIQKIGDEYYFIKIMGQGHAYCGCLIAVGNLSRQQDDSYLLFENGGAFLSYTDTMEKLGVKIRENKGSYRSGSAGNQFVVQGYSDLLNANILLVEEYHGIWSLQSIPLIMVVISVFCCLDCPVLPAFEERIPVTAGGYG